MKLSIKTFLTAILVFLHLELIAQFEFRLEGSIIGRDNGVLAFVESRARSSDYIEVPFKDGRFTYKGMTQDIKFYNVALLEDVLKGHFRPFQLILEPGLTEIEIILMNPLHETDTITPLNVRFIAAGEMNRRIAEFTTLNKYYRSKMENAHARSSAKRSLDEIREAWRDSLDHLFARNSGNVLGLFMVYHLSGYFSKDQRAIVLTEAPESLRNSKYYRIIYSEHIGLETNEIGQKLSDFSLPDRNGHMISLSQIASKNKYTLIDLWGSWCGPCIAKSRKIIPIYEKYRSSNIEIYGIAFETKKERWLNTLDKEGFQWTNVVEIEDANTKGYFVSKLLNPQGKVPYNILVDQSMTVVAKDLSVKQIEKILSKSR